MRGDRLQNLLYSVIQVSIVCYPRAHRLACQYHFKPKIAA